MDLSFSQFYFEVTKFTLIVGIYWRSIATIVGGRVVHRRETGAF